MENCVRASFFAATIAAVFSIGAAAHAYRWVDKDGAVHYTQTPPPPDAKNVQKKSFGGGGAPVPDLPYATQQAAKNSPVTLYVSPDCGALCDQARALLVKRAVPFKELNINTQKDIDDLKRLVGKGEVPALVVGAQTQSGFGESAYNGLLTSAGYPSSGPQIPLDALRKTESPAKTAEPAQGQR